MKQILAGRAHRWTCGWLIFLFCLGLVASPLEQPQITSIQIDDGQVIVTVAVPPGVHRVTLESRLRLGGSAWEPRQVARLDGAGGDIVFQLPVSDRLEVLRVRADETEPLPAAFYQGSDSVVPQPANSGGWWGDLATGVPGGIREGDGNVPPAEREVVESDIWQLRGDTLYFFNQYRGLQVIEVSEPDGPRLTGTLALPAAGEQMYLLETGELVLLTRNGCYYRENGSESEVLVLTVMNGQPEIVGRLPVAGQIQESRMVGTALYVAAQTYRAVVNSDGTMWEWGTKLSAFDLSDPLAPVPQNVLWYPGYNQVVTATDRYFILATQDAGDWRRSVVHLVDIEDPLGQMLPLGRLQAAGLVADKFKMQVDGEVLTIISEVRDTTLYTLLETFSLADPLAPVKLGDLELGLSERLHATRFAGDRVYVVTFFVQFQMDPLWVVDLSQPTAPRIMGELEIPGWSTYLHPWGDRLVACGIETNQTTVSLFDVADPERPALLKRLVLGSGWSWSEANNDEKAFRVLPDDGLILLPYQSWDEGESATRVQLIDLTPDTLVARGAIDHAMVPRRATLHRERVISVSGQELLCADITDRDRPKVTAQLDLAWPVDWVIVEGEYVLELSRGPMWYGEGGEPLIRLASVAAPDAVLGVVALPRSWPILAAEARDGRLYVVQGTPPEIVSGEDPPAPEQGSTANLRLTIYDLTRLPTLPVLGETEVAWDGLGWASELEVIWPRAGVLVLVGGGGGYWYPWLDWRFGLVDGDIARPGGWWPYYWGSNGGRLLAFAVENAAAPEWVSEVDLTVNGWWNFSKVSVADGLAYLTHTVAEPAPPVVVFDATSGEWRTNNAPEGVWVQRSFLDVIDYADPAEPVVRRPIETLGGLAGVSPDGAVIYTVGARWQPTADWLNDYTEWLDASAYDGVSLHLVDSLKLPGYWPRPVLVDRGLVLLGRTDPEGGGAGVLETWSLSAQGTLELRHSIKLATAAQALASIDGLLAVQANEWVLLFQLTEPAQLRQVGGRTPPGCVWPDLRHAVGDPQRGIWIPLGYNGVWRVPLGLSF